MTRRASDLKSRPRTSRASPINPAAEQSSTSLKVEHFSDGKSEERIRKNFGCRGKGETAVTVMLRDC